MACQASTYTFVFYRTGRCRSLDGDDLTAGFSLNTLASTHDILSAVRHGQLQVPHHRADMAGSPPVHKTCPNGQLVEVMICVAGGVPFHESDVLQDGPECSCVACDLSFPLRMRSSVVTLNVE